MYGYRELSCLVVIMSVVLFGPMLASLLVTSVLRQDDRVKSRVRRGLGAGSKREEIAQIQPLKKTRVMELARIGQ